MLHVEVKRRRGGFELDAAFELAEPTRVLGVVGPSGSGKTTLLDCVAGVETPDAGAISFAGEDWYQGDARGATPIGRRRVGYVFQDGLLFDHMSVAANLGYGQDRSHGGPTVGEVADVLGIGHLLDRRATEASGGERRRIALGRALVSGPRLLLLDEPLAGLDSEAAGRVLVYLRRVIDRFSLPTVYVSHTLSDVLFLCDRIIALDGGRVVHRGEAASVFGVAACTGRRALASLRSIIEARVVSCDAAAQTVVYEAPGGARIAALGASEVRTSSAIAVDARDVVIASARPAGISARNIFQGRVARVTQTVSMTVVELDVGFRLWAEVGFEAARELQLEAGGEAWAFFKASAVQRLL